VGRLALSTKHEKTHPALRAPLPENREGSLIILHTQHIHTPTLHHHLFVPLGDCSHWFRLSRATRTTTRASPRSKRRNHWKHWVFTISKCLRGRMDVAIRGTHATHYGTDAAHYDTTKNHADQALFTTVFSLYTKTEMTWSKTEVIWSKSEITWNKSEVKVQQKAAKLKQKPTPPCQACIPARTQPPKVK